MILCNGLTLYYVKDGHKVGEKTVSDASTAADLFAIIGDDANDVNVGKAPGSWDPDTKSFKFTAAGLARGEKYRYFIRPNYPSDLLSQKPQGIKLSYSKVELAVTEVVAVVIALTDVLSVQKDGTFQVIATESDGPLGKKDGKDNKEVDIVKEDLVYTLYYAQVGDSSIKTDSDAKTIEAVTAAIGKHGKVENLVYAELINTKGVKGLIGLDTGKSYRYFIRTAYKSEIDTKIASDSDKDTTAETVVLVPLSIKLSSVSATPKGITFQVTAKEPSGYLGRKADDGRTVILKSNLKYTLYYAKDGYTAHSEIANNSITVDKFVALVGDTDANANVGKIENLAHADLTKAAGVVGLSGLLESTRYYYFIRTVYPTGEDIPQIDAALPTDTEVFPVDIPEPKIPGSVLAYPAIILDFGYTEEKQFPTTAPNPGQSVAYSISDRDAKDDTNKVAIDAGTGEITVAVDLVIGTYNYKITATKVGYRTQEASLVVTVKARAVVASLGKAGNVGVKSGSIRKNEFIAKWDEPAELGTATSVEYFVFYAKKSVNPLDSPETIQAYAEDDSSSYTWEEKITGLDPDTVYVFFVKSRNKIAFSEGIIDISYSNVSEVTTLVESAAVTGVSSITIPSFDKIQVAGATDPVGRAGAFGKKSDDSDIVKEDFKYEIYYALEDDASGIDSSSDATAVKTAVDAYSGLNTQELGKTVAVDLAGLNDGSGILLGGGIKFKANVKYHVFIHTVYPSDTEPNSHVGIAEDTEAEFIAAPLSIALTDVVGIGMAGTFMVEATETVADLGKKTDSANTLIEKSDLRYILYYAKDGIVRNSITASSSISISGFVAMVSDTVDANAGKIADLVYGDLTKEDCPYLLFPHAHRLPSCFNATKGVVGLPSLDGNTKYYYFIRTVYPMGSNIPLIAEDYSKDTAVQEVTTLVTSMAVTGADITILAGLDSIRIATAVAPDGAFGKAAAGVVKMDFDYEVYYAEETANLENVAIDNSVTSDKMKEAVDSAMSANFDRIDQAYGKIKISNIPSSHLRTALDISLGNGVKFKANGKYRVFMRTVYPYNEGAEGLGGVPTDTAVVLVVAPSR